MFQLIKRLTPLLFLLLLPLGSRAQVSREAVIARVAEANKADGTLSFSFTRIRKTAMAAINCIRRLEPPLSPPQQSYVGVPIEGVSFFPILVLHLLYQFFKDHSFLASFSFR